MLNHFPSLFNTMLNKFKQSAKQLWASSKFFKSVVLTGTMLLFLLKPWFSKNNENIKAEIQEVLKKYPEKSYVVQETGKAEKAASFNKIGGNLEDPYDQIKWYVEAQDTVYFNQLRKYMETKDSTEQIKCKAVVYAILQDTLLNKEQRQVLALAYFERLAKMPWSNYRFRLAGNEKYKEDKIYADRRNRYSWYKSYLDVVALDEEIAKLDEKDKQLDEEIAKLDEKDKQLDEENKQLDEENKALDEENKALDRQIKLFQWLLKTYQNYKK